MSFKTAGGLLRECLEKIDKLEKHSEVEKELHDDKFKKLESENQFLQEEIEDYKKRETHFYKKRNEMSEEIEVLKRRVEELENPPKRQEL